MAVGRRTSYGVLKLTKGAETKSARSTAHINGSKHKPQRARSLVAVLLLLFMANVFDPGGALGVRYVAFVVACLSTLWALRFFYLPPRALIVGLVLFVVWPMWELFYGVVRGGDVFEGIVQVAPFLFVCLLALILPAFDRRTPLRLFYACLLVLAVVVIASFALIVLLPNSLVSQRLVESFSSLNEREGYFGAQVLGGIEVPWIYFRSTLFLVPAFVYFLFLGRLLRAGTILLALGLALSKAGVTIAVLFAVYYSLTTLFGSPILTKFRGTKRPMQGWTRRLLPILVIGVAVLAIFLSLPTFSDELRDAWEGNSETSQIRIDHFRSVMVLFQDHPGYLFVGQGVGVPFYSFGTSTYVQSFEIDHLNTIRKFGFPWFVGFSIVVFYSARGLIKSGGTEGRALGLALVSSYLASGTNPVLISDLFMMLMTLSYSAQMSVPLLQTPQSNLSTGAIDP